MKKTDISPEASRLSSDLKHRGIAAVVAVDVVDNAIPGVNGGPSVVLSAVDDSAKDDVSSVAETKTSNHLSVPEDGRLRAQQLGVSVVHDEFRSAVEGKLSNHGESLLKSGWIPTRWEHETMGVIETPLRGDVAYRYTLPNGVVDEISRDGQLCVRAPAFTFRDKDGKTVSIGPATRGSHGG